MSVFVYETYLIMSTGGLWIHAHRSCPQPRNISCFLWRRANLITASCNWFRWYADEDSDSAYHRSKASGLVEFTCRVIWWGKRLNVLIGRCFSSLTSLSLSVWQRSCKRRSWFCSCRFYRRRDCHDIFNKLQKIDVFTREENPLMVCFFCWDG